MKVLGFDVTGPIVTVGLAEDRVTVGRWDKPAERSRGNVLDHLIDHALEAAGWQRQQIDGLALATGPGSLTAMRIGWATASGWAIAVGIPVTGWSVPVIQHRYWFDPDVVARERPAPPECSLLCLIHHRGSEFYCYELNDGGDASSVRPRIVTAENWSSPIENGTWVVGPALIGAREDWRRSIGPHAHIVEENVAIVGGDQLAVWGMAELSVGQKFSLHDTPLEYGLPPDFRKQSGK